MDQTRFARKARTALCLGVALLTQGCIQQAGWNGIFGIDLAGGARSCTVPAASFPADGQTVLEQYQVGNDGGWCGALINRGGAPFESYVLVTRAAHGRVFAHRVGSNTRIDYTPDPGFAGTDSFAVRLIPGNAVFQGGVTVTK